MWGCTIHFFYTCPNCGEEADVQTKLGECALDSWEIGEKTILKDGLYRSKDGCYKCNCKPTIEIKDGIFVKMYLDPPSGTMQEMHWGYLEALGADPDKQIKDFAQQILDGWRLIDEE